MHLLMNSVIVIKRVKYACGYRLSKKFENIQGLIIPWLILHFINPDSHLKPSSTVRKEC